MKTIIAILLLSVTGCTGRKGLPVRFVVPDGYRGVLSVTLDRAAGVSVPVTNGEFVIAFPESGRLSVSTFDFFRGKHRIAAVSRSGQPLPTGHDQRDVAFRVVTYRRDLKTIVYLVGTQEEADAAFLKR